MTHTSRYNRQELVEGIDRQLIAGTSVLVVGLGGLGSPVATYLAGAGIGRLGLIDADTVSIDNLHRQVLYEEADEGLPKALCAARHLSALNSEITIEAHDTLFTAENAEALAAGYDIVVDCTDNFASRLVIDAACASLGKPWVHGSIQGTGGMVTVFGHTSGRRYADLFPDIAGGNIPQVSKAVIGPTAAVVAGFQSAEVLKLASHFGDLLDGRLIMIDLLTATTTTIEF